MLIVGDGHRFPVVLLRQKKSGSSASFGQHLIIPLMSMFRLVTDSHQIILFISFCYSQEFKVVGSAFVNIISRLLSSSMY
jgi:hypothetical protein